MPTHTADQQVVTRFAPSPTGYLHIGGARTALFNWLYARGRGGRFLLRVEDTDRVRSTPEATEAIFAGLRWLGLDWDGHAERQSDRALRHAQVVEAMVESGHAYRCFATQEEIGAARETAQASGSPVAFQSPWRDADPRTNPDGPSVIRLRAPREGETVIEDAVQGRVTTRNAQLDDMVLLRSDGTPTYMLAVVVDDHDTGVTHVIRGDDHLNNAARQAQLYRGLGWPEPVWAHIPLIHGPDGKKLSKRHGALGVAEYAAMGYPARAVRNYLARLGWSHGDAEYFDDAEAKRWFDLDGIGRAPARLDLKKLEHLSGQHIAVMNADELVAAVSEWCAMAGEPMPDPDALRAAAPVARDASRTLRQLVERARFALIRRPIEGDAKASAMLGADGQAILRDLTPSLRDASWSREALEDTVGQVAAARSVGLGKIASPLRAALAGRTATPSVFDMMTVLGRDETLARIADASS